MDTPIRLQQPRRPALRHPGPAQRPREGVRGRGHADSSCRRHRHMAARRIRGDPMASIARRADGRWRARYRDTVGKEQPGTSTGRSTPRHGSIRSPRPLAPAPTSTPAGPRRPWASWHRSGSPGRSSQADVPSPVRRRPQDPRPAAVGRHPAGTCHPERHPGLAGRAIRERPLGCLSPQGSRGAVRDPRCGRPRSAADGQPGTRDEPSSAGRQAPAVPERSRDVPPSSCSATAASAGPNSPRCGCATSISSGAV